MEATPTINVTPFRAGDFSTLVEALDYAAEGVTGYNFYSGRGELTETLAYAELRVQAQSIARRLISLNISAGSRVALVAETHPDFMRFFFACQYADLVPVPLPVSINLGARNAYANQLKGLLASCQPSAVIGPDHLSSLLEEARQESSLSFIGTVNDFMQLPESDAELRYPSADSIAYIQYTSGSTRFPRGVMISQRAVMSNLCGIIQHGVKIGPSDRCVSWLPFYHDMGLVGLVLVPLAAQISVDYLGTREFAMRPRQWLSLMSRNRGTISFSPPFGYELCARRLRDDELDAFDLSAWRVAGVGAETIRPSALTKFASKLAPSGFSDQAFLACYGMAECSLAVSFAPINQGIKVDIIDGNSLADKQVAVPVLPGHTVDNNLDNDEFRISQFVDCGRQLPAHEIQIRDQQGRILPDRHAGTIYVKGPSVMSGYFNDMKETQRALTPDGWLNTGDIGYMIEGNIVISGRQKDLIIINGRNIWPQDLEHLAESQPEVRLGDALAFSAPDWDGQESTVLVVQCREFDTAKRQDLVNRIERQVREELAIDCFVDLVPLHTLPRTSSGKLSRSAARRNFIEDRLQKQQGMCDQMTLKAAG